MHQRKKNRNRNATVHEGTYKTCILQANSRFSPLKLFINHTAYCLPFTAQSTYHLHLQHVPNMIELETWIASPRIPHTSTFSTLVWKQLFELLNLYCNFPGLAKKTHGHLAWVFGPSDCQMESNDIKSTCILQILLATAQLCLLPLSSAHYEKLIIPDRNVSTIIR